MNIECLNQSAECRTQTAEIVLLEFKSWSAKFF